MKLRIFSVVGEALNFGARRMETIMRTAWLPVVLLLILNMATVFAYLSVINERLITFADARTYAVAQTALQQTFLIGWMMKPWPMLWVTLSSFAVQLVLVASFSAPLIRLAGLGEKPTGGVIKVAFGSDQLRYIAASLLSILVMALFIFGPMGATAFYAVKYVLDTIAEIQFAHFPNAESLHTINIVSAQQVFFEAANLRRLSLTTPLLLAAPFAVGFWLVLIGHFRSPGGGLAGALATALGTLIGAGFLGALIWLALLIVAGNVDPASNVSHIFAIAALAILISYYANLRIVPYVGVAVCRKSLAPANTLRVTRGWNIFRMFVILAMIAAIVFAVQFLINTIAFPAMAATVNSLFAATDVYTKFVNGGENSKWVLPLFVSIWNGIKILYNIFWAFFSYGVIAGYLGRFYRDSERGDDAPEARAVWRTA